MFGEMNSLFDKIVGYSWCLVMHMYFFWTDSEYIETRRFLWLIWKWREGEDQVFFLITFPTSTEKSTNTFMNCDMKNWRKNVSVCHHHKYNIIIAVFCRVLRKNPFNINKYCLLLLYLQKLDERWPGCLWCSCMSSKLLSYFAKRVKISQH